MEAKEIKKQREALEAFYKNLYDKDAELVKEKALEYANGDVDKAKDFIEGYLYSIKQPHTRMIRLISMYTLDYVPYYRKHPRPTHINEKIRDIFREQLYPKDLFSKNDPTKRADEDSNDSSKETSETSEGE